MTIELGQLAAQRAAVPHAVPGPLTAPFWQGCAERKLLFQRCASCATANFPPAEHCRHCLSTALEWERSAGNGVVYSWTVVHRAATPVFETPYAPAIIDMAEGYQILTNVIDTDIAQLRVGLAVTVDFRAVDDDLWLPYFRPSP
jgi:uncharacterized OB-fold protein